MPLFVYHPDFKSQGGTRRTSLTQTIDVAPTIHEIFGQTPPAETQGISLLKLMERDDPVRAAAIYGVFDSAVNVTDGHYTYFKYPKDLLKHDLYQYTLMPTHMKEFFSIEELKDASLVPPFRSARECPC